MTHSHDEAYRFGMPSLYLSIREQAKLLIVRTDYSNRVRWTEDDAAAPARQATVLP